MNIIEKIGVLDTYNVDNCSKIRDNKNRIQKMKKTEKISGSKKIYSSPLLKVLILSFPIFFRN